MSMMKIRNTVSNVYNVYDSYSPYTITSINDIPISITIAWMVIFGVITTSIATTPVDLTTLPHTPLSSMENVTVTTYSVPTRVLFAVTATTGVYMSVLLHELGHAAVARRYGVTIEGIMLFIAGGQAKLSHIPSKPSEEFSIAIAGPITSILIAGMLYSMSFITEGLGSTLLTGLIILLLIVNIVIAVFNLYPAFPMDGGRILRAFLSYVYTPTRGTLRAVQVSQVLAGVLFVAGIVTQTAMGVIIAGFIFMATKQEKKQYSTAKQQQEFELFEVTNEKRDEILSSNFVITCTTQESIKREIAKHDGNISDTATVDTDYIVTTQSTENAQSSIAREYNASIIHVDTIKMLSEEN